MAFTRDVTDLLVHIDRMGVAAPGWQVRRVSGGSNNLVYYARNGDVQLAVKFYIDDERDRVGREYAALTLLRERDIPLAPCPKLLERYRYRQPVVVQTWFPGEVSAVPPDDDDAWTRLLEHYVQLATVRPDYTCYRLPSAFLNACSLDEGKLLIHQQLQHVPSFAYPKA